MRKVPSPQPQALSFRVSIALSNAAHRQLRDMIVASGWNTIHLVTLSVLPKPCNRSAQEIVDQALQEH